MAIPKTVASTEDGIRLRKFLARHYPGVGMMDIRKLCRTGELRINSKRCKEADVLRAEDEIRIPPSLGRATKVASPPKKPEFTLTELERLRQLIIHNDDDIVVFNKPAGLAVQGGGGIKRSLDKMAAALFPNDNALLVHRLDMDTSGVIVVAKNQTSAQKLAAAFQTHEVSKLYMAVLAGDVAPKKGDIETPINEKFARTKYEVVANMKGLLTLIRYSPETGRKHQLRIHSAVGLGAPIIGDDTYGGRELDGRAVNLIDIKHMYLFAAKITFRLLSTSAEAPVWFKKAAKVIKGDM
jgi:23S rRNA pseudouridine955/2504/2580 synthase